MYTAETDNKEELKADLDKLWSKAQLIIFTSTITVGMDFTLDTWRVFMVASLGCCPPSDAHQGCGRFRKVITNEIWATIPEDPFYNSDEPIPPVTRQLLDEKFQQNLGMINGAGTELKELVQKAKCDLVDTLQPKYIVSELISAPSILRVAAAYDMVPREACQFGNNLGWFQYYQYMCMLKQYPMENAKVTVSSEVVRAIEDQLNELLHPKKDKDNRYASIDTTDLIKSDSDFFTLRTLASGRRITAALQAAFEKRYVGKLDSEFSTKGLKDAYSLANCQRAMPGVPPKEAHQYVESFIKHEKKLHLLDMLHSPDEVQQMSSFLIDMTSRPAAEIGKPEPYAVLNCMTDLAHAYGFSGLTDFESAVEAPAEMAKQQRVQDVVKRLTGILRKSPNKDPFEHMGMRISKEGKLCYIQDVEQLLNAGVVFRADTWFHNKYSIDPPVRGQYDPKLQMTQGQLHELQKQYSSFSQSVFKSLKEKIALTRQAKQPHLKRAALNDLAMHGCKRFKSDASYTAPTVKAAKVAAPTPNLPAGNLKAKQVYTYQTADERAKQQQASYKKLTRARKNLPFD